MGLIAAGLGPHDQRILQQLEGEALRVLRSASSLVLKGKGKAQSKMWFGDKTDVWMKSLGVNLNQLASILNTKPIEVRGTHYQERETGTSAAAIRPHGGWNTYTGMTHAQNRNFVIRLDMEWNAKPIFRLGDTPGLSKFHTIVHELTHLVLNTDDVSPAYGETNCKNKSNINPANAKKNADNWAFFVDDMRNPVFPPVVTSKEWVEKSKLDILHPRSKELNRLDSALAAYEGTASPSNGQKLIDAFQEWISKSPSKGANRNRDHIVDRLKNYVDSV